MGYDRHKLTATQVEKLSRTPGLHNDGRGLGLRVASASAASWVLRYMLHGRAREAGLGPYPDVTLARAREKAAEFRALKADGQDPIDARASRKAQGALQAKRSIPLAKVVEAYWRSNSGAWRSGIHVKAWRQSLEQHCGPLLAMECGRIDTAAVVAVLEPIWQMATAPRIQQRLAKIMDYARVKGHRDGPNPAVWKGHLEHSLPQVRREIERHSALSLEETTKLMIDLASDHTSASRALQFMILTGARTGEALGATWQEINLAGATWTVPKERMKRHREHRVPLSAAAIAALGHTGKDESDLLFPGEVPGRPVSPPSLSRLMQRLGFDATRHGFRATFKSWAGDNGWPRELAEEALAHTLGNATERAYNRTDLLERRRKMMDAWAATVATPAWME